MHWKWLVMYLLDLLYEKTWTGGPRLTTGIYFEGLYPRSRIIFKSWVVSTSTIFIFVMDDLFQMNLNIYRRWFQKHKFLMFFVNIIGQDHQHFMASFRFISCPIQTSTFFFLDCQLCLFRPFFELVANQTRTYFTEKIGEKSYSISDAIPRICNCFGEKCLNRSFKYIWEKGKIRFLSKVFWFWNHPFQIWKKGYLLLY